MQSITNTFLKKMRKVWNNTTHDGDETAPNKDAYFDALQLLVDEFDFMNLDDKTDKIVGVFDIDTNMAILTDGVVVYSVTKAEPSSQRTCTVASISKANYIVVIDDIPFLNPRGVSCSQIYIKNDDQYIIENAELIVGRCHNLEAEWTGRG